MEKIIRITQHNEVFLEETFGLTKQKKEISLDQLAGLFISSLAPLERKEIDVPYGTIRYIVNEKHGVPISETIILECQPVSRPFRYHNSIFASIPFPKLIFKFTVAAKRIEVAKVCAVIDAFPHKDSMIYRYPYSNVYTYGKICFGNNRLPEINNLQELSKIPELFLSGENTDCLYAGANISDMALRELLELLDRAPFDEGILLPMGRLIDFIEIDKNH
jgi:hypothetical protein